MISSPIRQELVLVGGGHAHLQVLRRLIKKPLAGVNITVISQGIYTYYSGMIPSYVAGHYQENEIRIDLAPLCSACGANLIRGEIYKIDIPMRKVKIKNRPDLHFDLLSINVGSGNSAHYEEEDNSFSIRPIDRFLPKFHAVLAQAKKQKVIDVTVIGAGAAGVESALALERRFQIEQDIEQHRVTLVTEGEACLPECSKKIQNKASRFLQKKNIRLITSFNINEVKKNVLEGEGGLNIKYDALFWATPATAQNWFRDSGLAVDENGFILVDEHLACIGISGVFAAGDAISMLNTQRPKAGVYAVRQGAVLAKNLGRKLLGLRLKTYKPQQNFLALISLGNRSALGIRGKFSVQGPIVWYWKRWIDRKFVRAFDLSQKPNEAMYGKKRRTLVVEYDNWVQPLPKNYCGGCAAKISSELLTRALDRLEIPLGNITETREDSSVIELPDRTQGKEYLVQSVDGFRAILPDPYLSARITAAHSFNDIYAMGARPSTALVWVTLPWARSELMEEKLFQVMSGLLLTCQEAGVDLVGGHTSEGPELSIGMTVTGFTNQPVWQKGGAKAKDSLIITKPVGAGVIFAANMLARCSGAHLLKAVEELMITNAKALSVLSQYKITSCSDVSGFGLLGHAAEMASASQNGFFIRTSAVPILDGALDYLKAGIESSLQQANEHVLRNVRLSGLSGSDPAVKILMDPMTSGGLLFSLPANETNSCLQALKKEGYSTACIGSVTKEDKGRIHLSGE